MLVSGLVSEPVFSIHGLTVQNLPGQNPDRLAQCSSSLSLSQGACCNYRFMSSTEEAGLGVNRVGIRCIWPKVTLWEHVRVCKASVCP
jgi:hypothetical protein